MVGVGQRVLSSAEVVRLWKTAGVEALSPDLALYIKLAFALGGQRVEELLWALWSEFDIDAGDWSIPIEQCKNLQQITAPGAVPRLHHPHSGETAVRLLGREADRYEAVGVLA